MAVFYSERTTMQHLCYNQLVLSATTPHLDDIKRQLFGINCPNREKSHTVQLPLWPIENAVIIAQTATNITVQFTTLNHPPIVAYQLLCRQQPRLTLQAQYLNEFGLFAGHISQSQNQTTEGLCLTVSTNQTDITQMANEVFDLGWPEVQ